VSAICLRQREIIGKLKALGADTSEAVRLHDLFEDSQAQHLAHLARLENSY
jgi:hypothetical protein